MNATAKAQMKKLLDEHLEPVPAEMTAQELVDEVQNYWGNEAREKGYEEIEIDWDERDGTIEFKAKHPHWDWKFISVTFYNHREANNATYHIGYIAEDDRTISGCITGATHALGLAGFFYKLYCAGTKITGFEKVYDDNIYIGWD